MKLAAHRYGKSRVRLMKVLRDGETHAIKELTARVLLEGAFDRSYTAADNAAVIATDTMKNALYVLAHEHLGADNEPFARRVAEHFLPRPPALPSPPHPLSPGRGGESHAHPEEGRESHASLSPERRGDGGYGQVSRVTVELDERVWTRLAGHPHSFAQAEVSRPFTRLTADADGRRYHESGVRELIILKSTASGFAGFHRDAYTTLPETHERILATALRATWVWADAGFSPGSESGAEAGSGAGSGAGTGSVSSVSDLDSYTATNHAIIDALLRPFYQRYSPSVQATLFEMGTAALEACPAIARITLAMPNLHCLPVDLTPFGRTNRHELFVPIDEPHGDIEATVTR